MSRLIEIDPQVQSEAEPEGYEFGYYTFDQLPAMDVNNVQISSQNEQNEVISCELPIQTDISDSVTTRRCILSAYNAANRKR